MVYTSRGAFSVARLDKQGDARAFRMWTGHRTGSTFFCVYVANIKRLTTALGARSRRNWNTMTELERAKQRLCEEFENMPHSRYDLLGNAACGRKIRAFIIANINEHIPQGDCTAEMRTLMIDSGVVEENFEKDIAPYIDTYFKAKELIDKGYCKDFNR